MTNKLLIVLMLTVLFSCKKKAGNDPVDETSTFNKQELLVNMADQVILPAYRNFKTSLDSLAGAYENFKASATLSDYQLLKKKLHVAYLRYQRISLPGFGPGEDAGIRINFNIFPCDTVKIRNNINSGTYNLATASNTDTKGFPALDYLFYGSGKPEAEMMQLFSNTNRQKYVSDLLADMSGKINAVISAWEGTYRATFTNSLGTDVGSSIGFLVNQISYELDYLKNFKIATPLGLRSGGTPLPANSEAYYGGQSTGYALETLNAIENFYRGRSFSGQDGKGFDDYLDHLDARHGDQALTAAISGQFASARTKLTEVGNPLSDKVITGSTPVEAAYKELVKLLVLLKTDMPSSLGVVITYQDSDGD
jgi:predicted lipoprotein